MALISKVFLIYSFIKGFSMNKLYYDDNLNILR
jgi:hypothetical protein